MVTESPAFKKAAEDVQKLNSKPGTDEMLKLYGLYKVGKGEDISTVPKPSTFDFAGKKKREEWQKTVDQGISAEEAQKQYVAYVGELKKKHGFSG
ncbi:acyl binding [Lecanosticta acicola]|uniref:Acyl binding n=1 Tax=Lecanosticta acicola TaxID=111012 RepID=A0AAI8Z714_9PEZI|nr:acyl binding [Lecanosticta acicola]